MFHRIIMKMETWYEITGNQKLQEKQTIVNDSHRSIVKKPVQDKVRRFLFKVKIEWNEHIKNKNRTASLQLQILFIKKKAYIIILFY